MNLWGHSEFNWPLHYIDFPPFSMLVFGQRSCFLSLPSACRTSEASKNRDLCCCCNPGSFALVLLYGSFCMFLFLFVTLCTPMVYIRFLTKKILRIFFLTNFFWWIFFWRNFFSQTFFQIFFLTIFFWPIIF